MISRRAIEWTKVDFLHGPIHAYDHETAPGATVDFSMAENWLVHDVLTAFINEHIASDIAPRLVYGEGYTGTARLRQAMATHMNNHFHPFSPITAEDLTFAAGVTALNESCTLALCEAGESLMLGGPVYGGFNLDLVMRTGVNLEYVSFAEDEVDQLSTDCVARFEAGLENARERGVNVKGLILCNPHNPLGQCYTKDALIGLLQLCNRWNIHLISDEIYALSVYEFRDRPSESFTSILSLDFAAYSKPELVHVLYGMSKDFGLAGIRLGCLHSRNTELVKAVRSICRFTSPSQLTMHVATKILEDQAFVQRFLDTSRSRILAARLKAESLLNEEGIKYHQKGNAGFFIWLDLSPYFNSEKSEGDLWKAHDILHDKIKQAEVNISGGKAYHSPVPGRFRLIYTVPEKTLVEGITRLSAAIRK